MIPLYEDFIVLLSRKTLLAYTNMFFLNDSQKNNKIMYKYFKDECGKEKRKPSFRKTLD